MVLNHQPIKDKLKVLSRNFNFNDDFDDVGFDHILEENDKIFNKYSSYSVQLIAPTINSKWYCQPSHVLHKRIQRSWQGL